MISLIKNQSVIEQANTTAAGQPKKRRKYPRCLNLTNLLGHQNKPVSLIKRRLTPEQQEQWTQDFDRLLDLTDNPTPTAAAEIITITTRWKR